ncbi:hypothetical protein [Patulibacter sp.]|uniref:hypothetical protein n=1 Tax=Patulibacter sp. TaxID=1912859 RepID=UPI0027192CB4|nr:hypothetical protein [Patulibacter sp.]MDO9410718.1 hypothetical protein [Patulibacter sp.]
MTRPVNVVLIALEPPAADPAWSVLPPRATETLRGGSAVALLTAAGVPARQLSGVGATGLGPMVHEVGRSGATLVALHSGASPAPAVRLLTRLLLDADDAPAVAWTGVPAASREAVAGTAPDGVAVLGPSFEQALLAVAVGGPAAPGDAPGLEASPSPWTTGALRPGLAPLLGVEHARTHDDGSIGRPASGRLRDELRWIDARTVGAAVVPLVGPPVERADDEALDAVAEAAPHRIGVALPVAPSAPAALVRRADELGVARLDVVLTSPVDEERHAETARLAVAATARVHVRLDASRDGDVDRAEADVVRLSSAVAAVRLRWTDGEGADAAPPADLAVPELRSDDAVAEALRAERAVSARLLDAHRGVGVPGRGPRRRVHDVVWLGGDDPTDHAAWLATVLDRDGLLVRRDGGTSPVGGVPTAVVRQAGDGALLLPAGDRLVVRGWATDGPEPDDARLLLTLEDPDDLERLAADEAATFADGTLPTRTAGPRWALADEADVLGLAVPTARLERLWVQDGRVRATPGGPDLGAVGDDLDRLRSAARDLPAATGPLNAPRTRWFVRALLAVRALRSRGVEGPLRVAGLGGPLHPGVEGDHRPTSGVLVGAGDVVHVVDPVSGRVSRVTADTAFVWELLAVAPEPGAAAAALAAARDLPEDRAAAAVRQILAGLGASLLPVPDPVPGAAA